MGLIDPDYILALTSKHHEAWLIFGFVMLLTAGIGLGFLVKEDNRREI